MAIQRFSALEKVLSRKPKGLSSASGRSDLWRSSVFTLSEMKARLSAGAYQDVLDAIDKGKTVSSGVADDVATAMKCWAIQRGATHYTHWFHPLNGATAEKHDSFLRLSESGEALNVFEGKHLSQQEPDASSFPSGGLRNTFEARGYTAWDPSSPAFIRNHALCIPTIFISYTGEALDYKLPLLKALDRVEEAAIAVYRYFDKEVKKVIATLGWEQEYFLVDEALYNARPDLMLTGRTLMGHVSAKGQQLEDHYFGAIPQRVGAFMRELETEAHKLGIPIATRHNEVAPNQFEFAPHYEEANLAIDHNQLFMSLMQDVARQHDFVVLLNEKPFTGVNGSGKHNNWSLMTDTGENLLSPGEDPRKNLRFLVYLVSVVKAVHDHAGLLMASVATPANEHRLGANEAPPAIASVFLGQHITAMLDTIEKQVGDHGMTLEERKSLKMSVGKIPPILLDNTDRNRTSPFAFTGNRFEFRAVGASANCSAAITVLSAAVAGELERYKREVDALIAKGEKKEEALYQVLRSSIASSNKIRFEGDNYSEMWQKEARKRGLFEASDTVESFGIYLAESSVHLFEEMGILSRHEVKARVDIRYETYAKKIQIESRVLGDLALNHVIPTAIKYQNELIASVKGLKEILSDEEYQEASEGPRKTILNIAQHIKAIRAQAVEMVAGRKRANQLKGFQPRARAYADQVKPYLGQIRYHIDKLELTVEDDIWPLPKYRELLFIR